MEPEYLKVLKLERQAPLVGGVLWRYTRFFFNQCNTVTAPAESAKQDLQKHGVKKSILVLPNTINEHEIQEVSGKDISELKKKYKLAGHVLIYVGRLSHEKSLDILL